MVVDSLRYWVTEMHVDGFRFDLAATLVRGEHGISKYSAFLAIIHQDPVSESGQAHRRAVGHRRGRLSGGQFPRALGRVERALPRHRAALLEGRRIAGRRVRLPAERQFGPVPDQRQAARTRASISSPRTTASRSTTSSATTRSTTRPTARTTATATTTTTRGTAAWKGPTDDPKINALRAAAAAQFPRDAVPVARACRCCWRATNTAARRTATTTPIARTTRSAGWAGSATRRASNC